MFILSRYKEVHDLTHALSELYSTVGDNTCLVGKLEWTPALAPLHSTTPANIYKRGVVARLE